MGEVVATLKEECVSLETGSISDKIDTQQYSFGTQRSKEVREQQKSVDIPILSRDQELEKRRQELGLTRPSTMPSQGSTTITSLAPQASSNQQDVLSSSFSRIPMTTQLPIQKATSTVMSSAAIPPSTLMSSAAIPLTSQTEALSSLDIATAAAPPAYLDNMTAKDVVDWITCRVPIPEAIGMSFRRLQSRLGLFNPDKLVTPEELEKALNRLSVMAYSLQDLRDAIEALNNHYDSGANGPWGVQVKYLVQALLTNPTNVLRGNPVMQARIQDIGASLTHSVKF